VSKISIIIPCLNHLEDATKPCIESVLKYTDLSDTKVIVVCNGCNDKTQDYVNSLGDSFVLLDYAKPLGYTKATNAGILNAINDQHSEFVILLNNDTVILEQPFDKWQKMLLDPFADEKVGITGPLKQFCPHAKRDFLVFFCACLRAKMLKEIGILDEIFSPGAGEDTDLAVRAQDAGWKVLQVPDEKLGQGNGLMIGSFPIYHEGEKTVNDLPDWKEIFERNSKILEEKYKPNKIFEYIKKSEKPKILAEIATKDRYNTTLPMTIASLINQTVKPDFLLIIDDGDQGELFQFPQYGPLFTLLQKQGIGSYVIYGQKKGQHFSHETAQEYALKDGYTYIFRIDDDVILEPNVLEVLLSEMKENVGAVCCPVIVPDNPVVSEKYAVSIDDINNYPNIQWTDTQPKQEIEHLHCSFLFRPGVAHYNLELSPRAFREETLFGYDLFRAGYKLIYTPEAIIWHLKQQSGGCRSKI
jgi:GT2 family glycosyltransferase